MQALKHLPENREAIELGIDIRIDMRSSLQPLGEQAKVFERMREAEALAESLNDQRRLGQVSAYLSGYFIQAGNDPIRAIEQGQRALGIALAIGDFSLQIQANHFLGGANRLVGDFDRAIYHFKKNVDALVGDQIYDRFGLAFLASVVSRHQLALLLAERGEFAEAAFQGNEAVRIAEATNHPFSLSAAYFAVGHLHFRKGAIDKAIGLLEHDLELCRTWSIHQNIPRVAAALGCTYAAAGRVGEALPLLDLVNARARHPATLVHLHQGYLLIGKLGEALSLASEALDLSRRHGERSYEALVLYVLGETALYANPVDVDKTEDHYHQALALADELGMRPLIAHCHVGLGKLYQRTGNLEQAKMHLTDGVAMMREMEMGLWLERAEAELKEMS